MSKKTSGGLGRGMQVGVDDPWEYSLNPRPLTSSFTRGSLRGDRDKTKETHMEIIIPFPEYQGGSTYKHLQGYLKQWELVVHHAQKSVEAAEKNGVETTEDSFIVFDLRSLESSLKIDELKKEFPTTTEQLIDNYYEELQNIELRINLA